MGFRWSERSEERLREMWKRNTPTGEIAARLGITTSAVLSKAQRMHQGVMNAEAVTDAEGSTMGSIVKAVEEIFGGRG